MHSTAALIAEPGQRTSRVSEGTLELEISAGNGRVVPWAGRIARMAPVADVPEIRGSCDDRFAGVRSALARNFRDHGEVGAAVAITIEGRLVVDLSGVEFIDSTALGVLIEARRRLGRDEGFLLAGPGMETRRALRISGLDKHFGIHDTVDAALAAV